MCDWKKKLADGGGTLFVDVDWDTLQPKSDSKRKKIHNDFLDLLAESGLVQLNKLITRPRSNNVLDLICTNNPNIVSNIRTVTGVSDHLILLFDINMQPKRQSKPPHKVYTYSKADEEGLKSWLNKCNDTFFQTEPNLRSVDDNWKLFKKYTLEAMEKFIPHRMSKSKQSHPWINRDIIRHMRKRDKLFARACKENTQKLWSSYRKQRNYVTKLLRQSYNTYMEDVLGPSLDENPNNSGPSFAHRDARLLVFQL